METRTPIWLDCDPGHDDAFAIILSLMNPSLQLLGISTVMGNQTIEKTTLNALKMLSICNVNDVDVVKGQSKPLIPQTKSTCEEIHGDSGLDSVGMAFPDVPLKSPVKEKAIVHMYRVFDNFLRK